MSIRCIRFETIFNIRRPYITIFRIVDPLPIRREIIVKCLIGNILLIVFIASWLLAGLTTACVARKIKRW
jgi:hypothetical protein